MSKIKAPRARLFQRVSTFRVLKHVGPKRAVAAAFEEIAGRLAIQGPNVFRICA